ncbi:aldo/keto reductase [Cumulibacter manganitolerans]|uniref:aldo/keto reductase n=1 Tax=Cumulibacter manganitolerans TaxID=1884992 RepID=UPI0012965E17|nr:aldo/keto reductase [Cumulibacter manganitolerans]
MQIAHRRLGEIGPEISVVGLGCNNFSRKGTATETLEGTRAVIDAAVDAGITFFDTAEMYGNPPGTSETLMGEALKAHDREKVVIATKFGHQQVHTHGADVWGPKGGRTYIRNALEGSLRRLQTDYVDLFQMHNPDPDVPIAETLFALNELIDEGKVRHIGHTTFSTEQLVEANEIAESHGLRPFTSAQNEYSLLVRDAETGVLPEVLRAGMGFLPFFPLANGLLTGKYTEDHRPEGARLTTLRPEALDAANWEQLQEFQKLCDEVGLTMLQATFGWLLAREGLTSVIAGATRPEQVRDNAQAGTVELEHEVIAAIEDIFPIVGREKAPVPTPAR